MKELKEISNSIMNQAKYNSDNFNDNVVSILSVNTKATDFQKKMIQQNPMNSMQTQWYIAKMRKDFVFFMTLPFVISETFFKTWYSVYKPEGNIESSPKEENY